MIVVLLADCVLQYFKLLKLELQKSDFCVQFFSMKSVQNYMIVLPSPKR